MNYSETAEALLRTSGGKSAESDREKVGKGINQTPTLRGAPESTKHRQRRGKPQLRGRQSGKSREAERKKEPCRGLVQCTPPRRRLSASWS